MRDIIDDQHLQYAGRDVVKRAPSSGDIAPGPGEPAQIDQSGVVASMKVALRRFAKAVAVITSDFEGRGFAMAATAVSELSLDPPSMIVCVNKSASLFQPLSHGANFCINILDGSQQAVSAACGGQLKGDDRFGVGDWGHSSLLGIPCLLKAQAHLVCINDGRVDYGTHSIFIGRVVEVAVEGSVNPLIYIDGRYCSLPADNGDHAAQS